MRLRALLPALMFGAAAVGATACRENLNLTDPNAPNSANFWTTQSAAMSGINATYAGLLRLGTFLRWQAFSYDIRSDEGTSFSPWTDLQNFNKFTFVSYDFDVNRDTWNDSYTTISRANQVIANVPGIGMDATLRSRIVGEAKFIRALMYFHLVTLYGGNIPMPLEPASPSDRPASAGAAAVWAQIQKDLTDAIPVLPASYTATSDKGRATSGAAQALLGKALIQQQKWAEAQAQLQPLVGKYSLVANYADLFNQNGNNTSESVFEVQMGNDALAGSQGVPGLNIAKMVGPCGPSYCDGLPTRWFFNQFFPDTLNRAVYDRRLDATVFWNNPAGEDVFGTPFTTRYGATNQSLYFKKYGTYWTTDQLWDVQLNYKVIRYADVLLLLAEALNQQGHPDQAAPYVNQVRARAGQGALATTLTQAQMRDAILHERLVEFGLEGQRWLDLSRYGLLSKVVPTVDGTPQCAARPDKAAGCDADFSSFTANKSELLPIPQAEINLNPAVHQNPGW